MERSQPASADKVLIPNDASVGGDALAGSRRGHGEIVNWNIWIAVVRNIMVMISVWYDLIRTINKQIC
jgi:hypothetical protein